MNAPLIRCHCAECTKLDRLPVRRHGIPHAYQTTLDWAGSGSARSYPRGERVYGFAGDGVTAFELVPMTAAELRASAPAPSYESLPLFAGALEPTLF